MMLKLITVVYAWIWNVQPWQPAGREDWGVVALLSSPLDPLAILGLAFVIVKIVCHIRKGRSDR